MKKSFMLLVLTALIAGSAYGAIIDKKYITPAFNEILATKTTDDIAEGTAKYFSNALAQGAISASSPLTYGSGTVGCQAASGSQAGCLSSTDWSTFNGKQDALGFTAVPNTRTVNGHALNADVTVTKGDVSLGNVDDVQQLPMSYLDTATDLGGLTPSDTKVSSQAAVKSYVDTAISGVSSVTPYKAAITLAGGDITAQYVDMAIECSASSVTLGLKGAGMVMESLDYTTSVVASKTRITFAGDLSTGGTTPLIAGDVFYAQCLQ